MTVYAITDCFAVTQRANHVSSDDLKMGVRVRNELQNSVEAISMNES